MEFDRFGRLPNLGMTLSRRAEPDRAWKQACDTEFGVLFSLRASEFSYHA